MTAEERATELYTGWHPTTPPVPEIAAAIRAAVAEERERCAKVALAQRFPGLDEQGWVDDQHRTCNEIARKIRELE